MGQSKEEYAPIQDATSVRGQGFYRKDESDELIQREYKESRLDHKYLMKELGYAVEDGSLDIGYAEYLLENLKLGHKWLQEREEYDPY